MMPNTKKKDVRIVIEFKLEDNLFRSRRLTPKQRLEEYKKLFKTATGIFDYIPRDKRLVKVKTKFIDKE